MKKHSFSYVSYIHFAGIALWLIAAIFDFVYDSAAVGFMRLGGLVALSVGSFFQCFLLRGKEGLNADYFLFNFILVLKTAIALIMFFFTGAFGNIHSENAAHVARSVILSLCVLLLAVNFFTEKIYLRKKLAVYGENAAINTALPRIVSVALNGASFIYAVSLTVTILLYALACGLIGPLWLVFGTIIYSLFGVLTFTVLLGKGKLPSSIAFLLLAVAKFVIALVLYLILGFSLDASMESKAFAPAYIVFVYIDVVTVCMVFAVEVVAACFLFKAVFKRKVVRQTSL